MLWSPEDLPSGGAGTGSPVARTREASSVDSEHPCVHFVENSLSCTLSICVYLVVKQFIKKTSKQTHTRAKAITLKLNV